MKLKLINCAIRSWREIDAESIAEYVNNRKIWINLRDAFPHTYKLKDAQEYIQNALQQDPETRFAIEVDNRAAGSIGFLPHKDVERVAAEIGYWLAEPFWGRGIMTEALQAVTEYAIKTHHLTRVYALPFEWNHKSFRVLQKAGYKLEARLHRSAIKNGKIIDQLLYAYVVNH